MNLLSGLLVLACASASVGLAQRTAPTAAPQPEGPAKPTPRTPDGKPDLSGFWQFRNDGSKPEPLQLTTWGLDKFKWNNGPESAAAAGVYAGQLTRVEYDPVMNCYPAGLPRLGPPPDVEKNLSQTALVTSNFVQVFQAPEKVTMLYEFRHEMRFIYTDGRQHPENVEATWMGHSIGKWEGDTLVVDTIGLRNEAWIDNIGHEFSDRLHIEERYRRSDERTLEVERTLTDPIALVKPNTRRGIFRPANRDFNELTLNDCSTYQLRKPAFGEGTNGLLGISEQPASGKY